MNVDKIAKDWHHPGIDFDREALEEFLAKLPKAMTSRVEAIYEGNTSIRDALISAFVAGSKSRDARITELKATVKGYSAVLEHFKPEIHITQHVNERQPWWRFWK